MARFLTVTVVAVMLCLLITACSGTAPQRSEPVKSGSPESSRILLVQKWIEENRCGVVKGSKTTFNITGHLTAQARPGARIYLFTAANTSYDAAMYSVDNCIYLARVPLVDGSHFSFGPWPPGNYVLMVHGDAFDTAQGYPLIEELNQSNSSAKVAFQGGNLQYAVLAFSIKPRGS